MINNKNHVYPAIPINHLPLPALLISAGRLIVSMNQKAIELFDTSGAEQNLAAVIRNPDFLEACQKVLEGDKEIECEFVKTGRRRRTFKAAIYPIQDIANDKTKTNGAFIALYETTEASEAERMRSSFVADVSHELRSPLTSLIATIETLKGSAGEKPEVRERFLYLLGKETDRMHRIVNDLLSLSATEAQEHILPNKNVKLGVIVADVVKTLEGNSQKFDMALDVQIEKNLPPIRGEFDELYKVIYNLAGNALKYGVNGTPVVIKAEHTNNMVQVSVNNQGNLIPEKHIPRLTERFYRADKSRSREMGGTGLGLAIVKHIVNRHLGYINIESDEDNGTTFTVQFPQN